MEYDDVTAMLKQIDDLKSYRRPAKNQEDWDVGWLDALSAMEYWCQRNLEHRRGRG